MQSRHVKQTMSVIQLYYLALWIQSSGSDTFPNDQTKLAHKPEVRSQRAIIIYSTLDELSFTYNDSMFGAMNKPLRQLRLYL